MNIDEAKIIIDKQLEKVIYADTGYVLNNLHPIRVVQSLKSIKNSKKSMQILFF